MRCEGNLGVRKEKQRAAIERVVKQNKVERRGGSHLPDRNEVQPQTTGKRQETSPESEKGMWYKKREVRPLARKLQREEQATKKKKVSGLNEHEWGGGVKRNGLKKGGPKGGGQAPDQKGAPERQEKGRKQK